jgi:signal transduction histidine kinase
VHYGPDAVSVDITDDGTGDSGGTSNGAGAGRGLIGMRERVEAYGGRLESGPRTPRGWAVSARIQASAEQPS